MNQTGQTVVKCEWCGTVLRTWRSGPRVWGKCGKCDVGPVLVGDGRVEKKGCEGPGGAGGNFKLQDGESDYQV